jgi:hypothetical protein
MIFPPYHVIVGGGLIHLRIPSRILWSRLPESGRHVGPADQRLPIPLLVFQHRACYDFYGRSLEQREVLSNG